jgi:hypothetical protein
MERGRKGEKQGKKAGHLMGLNTRCTRLARCWMGFGGREIDGEITRGAGGLSVGVFLYFGRLDVGLDWTYLLPPLRCVVLS